MASGPKEERSTPRPREPLSAAAVESIAGRLGIMAAERRIALLEALTDGEAGVQELADRVGLPHQNVSHNLNLLWRAGILSRRSECKRTLYAIEDWSAWWIVEQIAPLVQARQDERETHTPPE